MAFFYVQTADVAVGNTTTETSILQNTITLPAGEVNAGFSLRLNSVGEYATTLVAVTLRVRAFIGAIVIGDTGVFTPPALSAFVTPFQLFFTTTFRTSGAAAGQSSRGTLLLGTTGVTANSPASIVYVGPAAAPNVDLTAASVFDIRVTWGTANASNIVTTMNAALEIFNA